MKNTPDLWLKEFPIPDALSHKYTRGQVCVLGGVQMTGAACLSADGAARIGAGLVTIVSPYLTLGQKVQGFDPIYIYKSFRPYIIARNDMTIQHFVERATVKGRVCAIVGPGLGDEEYETVRAIILSLLQEKIPMVIDADGLNAFAGHEAKLYGALHRDVILTPHDGEFKRVFPSLARLMTSDRRQAAVNASSESDAVVVLKGAETTIATPDGQVVINDKASPFLATAGAGDVLSGIVGGLLAQGMQGFLAACASVWIHAKSAEIKGAGLVASDLNENIAKVLKETLGIDEKVG